MCIFRVFVIVVCFFFSALNAGGVKKLVKPAGMALAAAGAVGSGLAAARLHTLNKQLHLTRNEAERAKLKDKITFWRRFLKPAAVVGMSGMGLAVAGHYFDEASDYNDSPPVNEDKSPPVEMSSMPGVGTVELEQSVADSSPKEPQYIVNPELLRLLDSELIRQRLHLLPSGLSEEIWRKIVAHSVVAARQGKVSIAGGDASSPVLLLEDMRRDDANVAGAAAGVVSDASAVLFSYAAVKPDQLFFNSADRHKVYCLKNYRCVSSLSQLQLLRQDLPDFNPGNDLTEEQQDLAYRCFQGFRQLEDLLYQKAWQVLNLAKESSSAEFPCVCGEISGASIFNMTSLGSIKIEKSLSTDLVNLSKCFNILIPNAQRGRCASDSYFFSYELLKNPELLREHTLDLSVAKIAGMPYVECVDRFRDAFADFFVGHLRSAIDSWAEKTSFPGDMSYRAFEEALPGTPFFHLLGASVGYMVDTLKHFRTVRLLLKKHPELTSGLLDSFLGESDFLKANIETTKSLRNEIMSFDYDSDGLIDKLSAIGLNFKNLINNFKFSISWRLYLSAALEVVLFQMGGLHGHDQYVMHLDCNVGYNATVGSVLSLMINTPHIRWGLTRRGKELIVSYNDISSSASLLMLLIKSHDNNRLLYKTFADMPHVAAFAGHQEALRIGEFMRRATDGTLAEMLMPLEGIDTYMRALQGE